jgi:triacylglycerol esterase/lipase EstA (alpha/beta hydrolase family)
MWLLNTGRSSSYRWLGLTLAALVLSIWVTVGFASGIARADGPSPSGGDSSSEGSPGPQHVGSAGAPKASTPDPSKRSGGQENPGADHHDAGIVAATADAPGAGPAADDSLGRGNPPARNPHPGNPDRTTNRVTTADTTTESSPRESEETADKTAGGSEPRVRHSSRQPGLTSASAKPAEPITTSHRSAVAQIQQLPKQVSSQQPVVANIAPTEPPASINQSGASAVNMGQLGRQMIGLVSDVGTVAASAVYTVANSFAQAFGPHSFLGVPYALATALANSAAAAGRTLIGAPLNSASTGQFPVNYGIIDGLTFFNPQQPPPGANDPSITVTAEHPLPIILINGTTATQGTNWGVGAPVLANAGYKVYTFNYGNITHDPNSPIQATADIRQSGLELAAEVDKVLAETGAPKVILIGHSQGGGILPVYYINNLGGADKVSQLIGIAPSNHGTNVDGLIGLQDLPILGPLLTATANSFGQALEQQAVGSPFQQEVYGNGDTRPGVLYTTIASTNDEVVTPYTQQALNGPNVTNIVLQDLYPGLPAGHLGAVLSPQVWSVVLNALASNPQANPQVHSLQSQELAA